MNAYEEKQERRRERFAELAEKAQGQAESRFRTAGQAVDGIPMGQPILVGHHSERRHRAALAKCDRNMRAGCEAQKKAKYYTGKAASVGHAGISSDDPDAVDKLREKLSGMERMQATMKAVNKAIRRKGATAYSIAQEAGVSVELAEKALKPDFCGRIGFPNYALQNNNANIRRVKERIADLEKLAEAQTTAGEDVTTHTGEGWKVVESVTENRLMIIFDAIPAEETRGNLKRHGFRWSPTNGAWQRHLNNAARYNAALVLRYPA